MNRRKKIFLIAGHNLTADGKGTGAHGFLDEAVEAIRVRDALAEFLKRDDDLIVFTEDDHAPLSGVTKWLKNCVEKGDIVIDIHFNAATPAATGTEVFVPNEPSDNELVLASLLAQDISGALGIPRRSGKLLSSKGFTGVKYERESQHPTLAVLSAVKADVSVLVEICFVTNEHDCRKYKENFGELIKAFGQTIQLTAQVTNFK